MAKYYKPKANEWIYPIQTDYAMACCDCGLVHMLDFEVHDGRVRFRVRRNTKRTNNLRKKMGIVFKETEENI
jgi:hypothetical protein